MNETIAEECDTSPEVAKWVRERLMERTESERLKLGCEMFDISRRIMLSSFPPGLTKLQTRRMIWERTYGTSSDFIKE